MPRGGLTSILLRVPGRLALLLGLGAALSATGAGTTAAASDASSDRKTDPVIRSDGGRVYLAEGRGGFQPLTLGDTPEARRLLSLLDGQAGATTGLTLRPTL